ncbi:MFS transporter [Dactylosporangium roseum]|uniref:MFS transporter n=1 Tax=Dactylosporangium roseum TaxID=47989 RepID=A0ABY5ZCN1_9ACTN|nr:MFS transporter [Dactylosporangium roseum]UWZ39331.1 MFS transporter [Dactylosporangium roseum]
MDADSGREQAPGARRRALVRHPQFRTLLLARSISFFGDSLAPIAIPFAVLAGGGSAADVGIVLGAGTATNLILLLSAGVIADRLPRRLLLITSDVSQGLVMTAMCAVLMTGHYSLWLLVALQILFGAGMALNLPSFTGILPQVIDRADIQAANGLLSVAQSTAQISGPAIAGILVAVGSPGIALGVDAATFFLSALLLLGLRVHTERSAETMHFVRDLIDGWQEMARRRWYWVSLLAHSGCNFSIGVFSVMGPVIVAKHGGATGWGLVSTAGAIGSLLGGVAVMRLWLRRPVLVGNLSVVLYAPALLLLIRPAPVWAIMAGAGLAAFAISILNGAWYSTVQQLIPEKILSRLASYDWLISFATLPLGYALAGPLSDALGVSTLLVGCALLLALPCALTIFEPTVRGVRSDRSGEIITAEPVRAA